MHFSQLDCEFLEGKGLGLCMLGAFIVRGLKEAFEFKARTCSRRSLPFPPLFEILSPSNFL